MFETELVDGQDLDVAIVGGGVSGLYSGWRLCTAANPPASVGLFECSDRLGGRLESVVLPGMKISGELGGMRYMTSQVIATTLIERVFADELEHVDFPMGDAATLLFYLRKQRFAANSWTEAQGQGEAFQTRYAVNDGDAGLSADQLFNKIAYDVLMSDPAIAEQYASQLQHPSEWVYNLNLTSQNWDAIKPVARYCFAASPYDGMLVNDLGFWNVIKDQCSEEGYAFLSDAGGYYSNTINWNAAEAFENMVGDFTGQDVAYRTIVGGYEKIADTLAAHLAAAPQSLIWGGTRLTRVDPAPGGPRRYALTLALQDTTVQVFADAVILALPRRSLELLDQDCMLFSDDEGVTRSQLAETVPSVLLQPSMKLLMAFEEPWWKQDFGATSGESITDLPMRQCYYFGTDADDSHSLFLASYNDMDTVSFWSPLAQTEPLFQPRATSLASTQALAEVQDLQAPALMVAEAMNQVRELHGTEPRPIPDPYVTYWRDWQQDPFGGGYHAWDAGVSVKDVMPYMRAPLPGEGIHVCGECYSDLQGWIEGAFCVAEHMLQDHFGLERPDWLAADYYMGW
jgi:monoamine oxidase